MITAGTSALIQERQLLGKGISDQKRFNQALSVTVNLEGAFLFLSLDESLQGSRLSLLSMNAFGLFAPFIDR